MSSERDLRHRVEALEHNCQTLEWRQAEAWALVLSHEGHIDKLNVELAKYKAEPMVPLSLVMEIKEAYFRPQVVGFMVLENIKDAIHRAIEGAIK